MLEVFAIIGLCKVNKNNAIARGRRPGGYIALTIVLWIGMEFIGAIVGMFVAASQNGGTLDSSSYKFTAVLFAYGFAGVGALISFLCAKFGPQGDYVDPSVQRYQPGQPYNTAAFGNNTNTPAYMQQPGQSAQPQEFVHVENPYQAPAAPQTQYCEFCGQPIKPGSKFCSACGSKAGKSDIE